MALCNIFKTLLNHLKLYYIIFISFWILVSFSALAFIDINTTPYLIINLLYLFTSGLFSLILGSLAFGSYGKTFILIQNNRKNYIIASILFSLLNSFVFSIIALLTISSINVLFILFLFALYLCLFYIGSLYGLFVKYNKKIKRIVFISFFTIIFILLSLIIIFENSIVDFNYFNNINYSILFTLLLDIVLIITCSVSYLKMNILKSYSIE